MQGVICTVVLAALSLALITTHAFPDGAPWHPAGNASDAPGGYFIDSDLRDTNFFFNTTNTNESQIKYTITLFSNSTEQPFRGFVIQVCIHSRTGYYCPSFAGEFVEFPPLARLLGCSDPSTLTGGGASLTHVDNSDKLCVSAVWAPPPRTSGIAQIRYTVVTEYNSTYYADLDAANYPPPQFPGPTQCPPLAAVSQTNVQPPQSPIPTQSPLTAAGSQINLPVIVSAAVIGGLLLIIIPFVILFMLILLIRMQKPRTKTVKHSEPKYFFIHD